MPGLRDTELRVLLIILRQTLGWKGNAKGGHKERDWITHSELCRRTGRASGAVSAAVDSLIRYEMIIAEDFEGNSLETAASRRWYLGKLFYRAGSKTSLAC